MAMIIGSAPTATNSGASGPPEKLTGTSFNDTFDHKGGDDQIDGGAGTDTALFFDSKSHYAITTLAGITHVKAVSGAVSPYAYSEAVLVNVELIQFADGSVDLSTTSNNTLFGMLPTATNSGASGPPEKLTGTSFNDTFDHRGGNDQIDGGAGTDTALFFDSKSHYAITTLAGITHVKAVSGAVSPYAYSEAVLVNVELIQFADGSVDLSTTSNNTLFGMLPTATNSGASGPPEKLTGTSFNDTFDHRGGNDQIDGGAGTDTALFFDSKSHYAITTLAGITHVKAVSGAVSPYAYSEAVLVNVERLQFTDKSLALDITGNAGTTAKILGVVFGEASVSNTQYVGIGLSLLDSGVSYSDLMQFALTAAGATTNARVVNLLWTNLFHSAPTAAEASPYVAMLDDGSLSVGALGVIAADLAENTNNINLTGLQQTGIEYSL
jgi:Ca2+-binding RTX toxin-like protein